MFCCLGVAGRRQLVLPGGGRALRVQIGLSILEPVCVLVWLLLCVLLLLQLLIVCCSACLCFLQQQSIQSLGPAKPFQVIFVVTTACPTHRGGGRLLS